MAKQEQMDSRELVSQEGESHDLLPTPLNQGNSAPLVLMKLLPECEQHLDTL
jgi:hypothetical protein